MKNDIKKTADIKKCFRTFYALVLEDQVLYPFFKHFDQERWQQHIDIMTKFWSNVIFQKEDYEGDPMQIHKKLHQMNQLNREAFGHWLHNFEASFRMHFEGPNCELAIAKSKSIASYYEQIVIKKN